MAIVASGWAASVGPGGYTNDFSVRPAAADWSSISVAGTTMDITNAAAADAAVQLLAASGITNQVGTDAGNPPTPNASALWSSTGSYLQTRPSGNKYTALMAKLLNNSGGNTTAIRINYSVCQTNFVPESVGGVDGHRVYYSLTEVSGGWLTLPTLCSVSASNVTVTVSTNLPLAWNAGATLYLLWLDDNGPPTDSPNQIDNFSASATLPPVVVAQPQNTFACQGSAPTFTVSASGSAPLHYQWRKSTATTTNAIPNATNASHTIPSVGPDDEAGYSVVVTSSAGSVTSVVATLTISTNPVVIVAQPQSTTNEYGTQASFVVDVAPDTARPLSYQWFRITTNGNNVLPGETTPALTLGVYETNVAEYFVTVSNCANAVTSQPASLALFYAPLVITNQPQNIQVMQGGSAVLSVGLTGSRPLIQWYKGTAPILGATNATLTLSNLVPTDSGFYHVEASNPRPSLIVSTSAMLIVQIPSFTLVPLTNAWKYNQQGTNLGMAWRATDYDDSTWPTGQGVLAKEDNAAIVPLIRTPLSLTNSSGATNLTFYFRTTFNLTNDLRLIKIVASNLVDDAHVLYVNGVEAYRSPNMPTGTITYATFALAAHTENAWEIAEIPSSLLVQGINTVAVEVHQSSLGSADIVWGFVAQVTFPPPTMAPAITNQPADLTVQELTSASFTVGYVGEAVTLQWFKQHTNDAGADPVPGGIWSTLTISSPAFGVDEGDFFVVISNVLGVAVSRLAHLTVAHDTNAPVLLEADGTLNATTVVLSFNEPLWLFDAGNPSASPTNLGNYTITNTFGEVLPIISAMFTNGTNIILTTAEQRRSDANYILTVRAAMDAAPARNLAINLALPVSSLLRLIDWVDYYSYIQPLPWYDPPDDFVSGAWRLPEYDPTASLASWFYPGWSAFWLGPVSQSLVPAGSELSFGSLSSYYRKPFNFQGSRAGLRLSLRHLVGDGAVFHLNGVELARFNMPPGSITPDTSALANIGSRAISEPLDIPLENYNVLAAELHAATSNDTSLLFALELQARIESLVTGQVVITTPPADVIVTQSQPATFGFRGVAGRTFRWLSNSVPITGATNPVYTIASAPLSAGGQFFRIVASNESGAVTSAPARLTVLPDLIPPALLSAYLTASNQITVTFSEAVTEATATNLANYVVTNGAGEMAVVTGVTFLNQTNAVLTLGPFAPSSYTVVVNNVTDANRNNPIAASSAITVGVQNYPLVADGTTVWRYNQNNEDLGTAWRATSYDDSSWSNGVALFDGYTGGSRATVGGVPVLTRLTLTNAASGGRNLPTYYFRARFCPPLLGSKATMTLRPILDDGAAFYLNGQLLHSIRVTLPTTFGAYATASVGDAAYEGPFNVSTDALLPGTNVFTVELKNSNTTSSDITFGAWLTFNMPSTVLPAGGDAQPAPPTPPALRVERQGANHVRLSWTGTGLFTLQFTDEFNSANTVWTTVPNAVNPCDLPATNATRFYRLKY